MHVTHIFEYVTDIYLVFSMHTYFATQNILQYVFICLQRSCTYKLIPRSTSAWLCDAVIRIGTVKYTVCFLNTEYNCIRIFEYSLKPSHDHSGWIDRRPWSAASMHVSMWINTLFIPPPPVTLAHLHIVLNTRCVFDLRVNFNEVNLLTIVQLYAVRDIRIL